MLELFPFNYYVIVKIIHNINNTNTLTNITYNNNNNNQKYLFLFEIINKFLVFFYLHNFEF